MKVVPQAFNHQRSLRWAIARTFAEARAWRRLRRHCRRFGSRWRGN